MSVVGIVSLPDLGHINPMLALAGALQARGHRVLFFQLPDLQARIAAAGVTPIAVGADLYPPGSLERRHGEMGTRRGFASIRLAIRHSESLVHAWCRDIPPRARELGVDLLVVDQLEPSGAAIAAHLDVPFVTVCNSIPFHRDASCPPAFTAWEYRPGRLRRWRNRMAFGLFDLAATPLGRVVNGYRAKWRLPAQFRIEDTGSPFAILSQLPPALDFPSDCLPPHFHYVGPLRGRESSAVAFPWEALDGRPVVYGSLGTLQNRRTDGFFTIAAACAGLGVQLVLSHGGALDERAAVALRPNALVVPYAPQTELLARATLTVTHASINTVLDSLAHAVPLVAVPIAHDQPGTAERVRWAGVGDVVPWSRLSVARLRDAIRRVLDEPSYRQHAGDVKDSIARAGGAPRAAAIVEQVLRTGRAEAAAASAPVG